MGDSMKNKTYNKRKVLIVFSIAIILLLGLIGRLSYLMIFEAEYYQEKAEDLHEREREIKAARGEIIDRNGVVLATNKSVCTISVIHSQIKDEEEVIEVLAKELQMDEPAVRQKVEKVSSREKIKSNVDIEIGDKILPEGYKKMPRKNASYRQSIRIFYRFIGEKFGADEDVNILNPPKNDENDP